MGEVIKPEDVREGDRIRVSWTDRGVRRSDEGVVAFAAGASAIVYIGGGTNRPYSQDRIIELLDRPKTPGQVAYEAWHPLDGRPWEDTYPDIKICWERAAQAVLDAAAKP